jgi:hypothetical protein
MVRPCVARHFLVDLGGAGLASIYPASRWSNDRRPSKLSKWRQARIGLLREVLGFVAKSAEVRGLFRRISYQDRRGGDQDFRLFSPPSDTQSPSVKTIFQTQLEGDPRRPIRVISETDSSSSPCLRAGRVAAMFAANRPRTERARCGRFGSILGQGEDRAWRCDSAEYMRSQRDQRRFGLGGKRA